MPYDMSTFVYIPITLYLVFAGLYLQQGLMNVLLYWRPNTKKRPAQVYFVFASAALCTALLLVLLGPDLDFTPAQIRFAFYLCWLVGPIVGYFYVQALAEHLEIEPSRVRWMQVFYILDLLVVAGIGLYTWITGRSVLFSHEQGARQSLIDMHLGGAFSPNDFTIIKVAIVSLVVLASAVFFFREILSRRRPDTFLLIGIALTALFLIAELVVYLAQWSVAFSLLPFANVVEVVRLTYLQTITAGQNLEQTRRHLRQERLNLKSHLGALAHDVRTPLTSLKLGLSRLKGGRDPEQLAAELSMELEYLHVVFSNIVTLFELELGADRESSRRTDVCAVLDVLRARFGQLAHDGGVQLAFSDESGPLLTRCDSNALEQALSNLLYSALVNAAGHVAVTALIDGNDVVVRVQDDGPPTQITNIPELSDRVYRKQLEGRELGPGWGLGLAITQAVVNLYGGRVSVAITEDAHTYAEVRVPAAGDAAGSN